MDAPSPYCALRCISVDFEMGCCCKGKLFFFCGREGNRNPFKAHLDAPLDSRVHAASSIDPGALANKKM